MRIKETAMDWILIMVIILVIGVSIGTVTGCSNPMTPGVVGGYKYPEVTNKGFLQLDGHKDKNINSPSQTDLHQYCNACHNIY